MKIESDSSKSEIDSEIGCIEYDEKAQPDKVGLLSKEEINNHIYDIAGNIVERNNQDILFNFNKKAEEMQDYIKNTFDNSKMGTNEFRLNHQKQDIIDLRKLANLVGNELMSEELISRPIQKGEIDKLKPTNPMNYQHFTSEYIAGNAPEHQGKNAQMNINQRISPEKQVHEIVLSSLMPGRFKPSRIEFEQVEDLYEYDEIELPEHEEALVNKNKRKASSEDLAEYEDKMTMKTLMNMMNDKADMINKKAENIENQFKKAEKEIEDHENEILLGENRDLYNEMKKKTLLIEKEATDEVSNEIDDVRVANIMADNKMLLNEIDLIKNIELDENVQKASPNESLNSTIIDALYETCVKNDPGKILVEANIPRKKIIKQKGKKEMKINYESINFPKLPNSNSKSVGKSKNQIKKEMERNNAIMSAFNKFEKYVDKK